MPVRTISSLKTLFIKIFMGVWVIGFGLGAWSILLGNISVTDATNSLSLDEIKLMFLIFWIMGTLFSLFIYFLLKRVRVDEHNLYVSNYFREIVVPLDAVESVMQGRAGSNVPVVIQFKEATRFGKRIVFLPKTIFTFSMKQHPIVAELKQLANID